MSNPSMAVPEQTNHRVCPWWLAYSFDNPIRRLVHPAEKILEPYVKEGMTVMDFGCGFGHFTMGMARLVGNAGTVVAADIQQKMLDKTMARTRKAGLASVVRPLRCGTAGVGELPELDFVLVSNALHETPDPSAVLAELYARLKPDGVLYLMEPGGHMNAGEFESEVDLALQIGFRDAGRPKLWREMCVLLEKPGKESA